MNSLESKAVEARIQELGQTIDAQMRGRAPTLFDAQHWEARLLDRVMADESFKIDAFRFVDVLPVLQSTSQISRHVDEYLLRDGRELPRLLFLALKAAAGGLTAPIAAAVIRRQAAQLAERFIAGPDPVSALSRLRQLHVQGIGFTADLLGEATLSQGEAQAFFERYARLIRTLASEVHDWPDQSGLSGPRAHVSIKVSAMDPHLDPVNTEANVARLTRTLLPLLLFARDHGVAVTFDLEQWHLHATTMAAFAALAEQPDLRDWPHLGIVIQAYLKQARNDLARLLALARRRNTPLHVRLVKGAYWDYETVLARQHGWPSSVHSQKTATDFAYEQLSRDLLAARDWLRPAFGSHNLRSLLHAIAAAELSGVPPEAYEMQMLYGMAEPERAALRDAGYRLRVYCPVGDLLPGMAYLVRRLLENTSNQGFLRLTFREHQPLDLLLATPCPEPEPASAPPPAFANCPPTDFSDEVRREEFADAIEHWPSRFPIAVPVIVAGHERGPRESLAWQSPNTTALTVARVDLARGEDVDAAIAVASQAWPEWRDCPVAQRSQCLRTLADRLAADRVQLAALEVWEEAKPWREADADVAEAIDFCRCYAWRAELELAPTVPEGDFPGEDNRLWWEGRGPTAVIAPWNFPLAILCGMTVAALVAGNPVLIKPAEQSSAVALAFFRHLLAAGIPAEVAHFLPGVGEEIGRYLVVHPGIATIAFTGSRDVGLQVIEAAARPAKGQRELKQVICEMGGKNAIVIDDDADLDEAVAGVLASAFGYAGQKCSACSRAIVVGAAAEPFIARLVDATRDLVVGPSTEPSCQVPPVIDEAAVTRLRRWRANPGDCAEALYVGNCKREDGRFVAPAIFEVTDALHPLMQTELFGPILAVMRVPDFATALAVANTSDYALTGSVYSRLPSHLRLASQRFRVGNLYLNRGCTGALVHRQPFGGFGMSGLGTKAGGPGYLRRFCVPRTVTENTSRRGFTPSRIL